MSVMYVIERGTQSKGDRPQPQTGKRKPEEANEEGSPPRVREKHCKFPTVVQEMTCLHQPEGHMGISKIIGVTNLAEGPDEHDGNGGDNCAEQQVFGVRALG